MSGLTIRPQYAEGNHYNAVNGELLRFGDGTCFYFQSVSKQLRGRLYGEFQPGLRFKHLFSARVENIVAKKNLNINIQNGSANL